MFFDTHAHLNDEKFDSDREALIASLQDGGVSYTCEIGFDMPSSYAAAALAEKYDFIYAAAGIHPHDADTVNDESIGALKELLKRDKVVAVGEIGLDYYYDDCERSVQREAFARQLELAKETHFPIAVHTRDAMEDTINILRSHGGGKGIIHCYSGSRESAKILLDMGYFISFAGPITFKNANSILDVVKYVPADRLLIETDSPYLAPVPYRGKRNCPLYVAKVAEKAAELKGMKLEELAAVTLNNAKKAYSIE